MSRPPAPSFEPISDELIETVCDRLAQGKQIRQSLPLEGRLHIDRPLPFLCVYRRPAHRPDAGTEQLVTGEAAHLIASDDRRLRPSLTALVRGVAGVLAESFEAFLIIELWSRSAPLPDGAPATPQPRFRIAVSKIRPPTEAIEALEKGLKRIKLLKQRARVEVIYSKKRAPAPASMLLSSAETRKLNCFLLGLEVDPVYREATTSHLFPMALRTLHKGIARAFKQAFFEFSRSQTNHRPTNYQALGRRSVVRALWHIDRRLAEISDAFDFLLQITPVNTELAWTRFKKQRFERSPIFYYRPLMVDPALLKRKLYQITLERVEDPTLYTLFREKRSELDRQLMMLEDRGKQKFLYGSLQLFGGVSPDLLALAESLLKRIPPRSRENSGRGKIDAAAFADRAWAEIEYYRQQLPSMPAAVQIREDTVGLMVSQGNLLIGQGVSIPPARVEALLQHEVGTHIVTYHNGQAQPFHQLYTGLAGYEELQEGLAVLAEYLVGGLSRPRLRLLAGRVVAAHALIEGASFIETFRLLNKTHGFAQRTAFMVTTRLYRGGGLTKDAVYLRGLVRVLKYLQDGGDLEPLFVGKIAANHIPIIKELQWRHILQPPPLRPRYMDSSQAAQRLAHLRQGVSVLDLIKKKKK